MLSTFQVLLVTHSLFFQGGFLDFKKGLQKGEEGGEIIQRERVSFPTVPMESPRNKKWVLDFNGVFFSASQREHVPTSEQTKKKFLYFIFKRKKPQ